MSTDIDWQRELDAAFPTTPDEPVGTYVAAGHRAVRRRRLTAVAAGLGAAAVVVGTAWGVAPGRGPSSTEAPAAGASSATSTPSAPPTSAAESSPSPTQPSSVFPWGKGEPPARSTQAGLEIREGAVVHERRDDLFPGKGTESVALDISFAGKRWWMSLEWDEGGGAMTSVPPDGGTCPRRRPA